MSTHTRVTTTDAEIEAAIAEANVREDQRTKAISAEYRVESDSVVITLASGITIIVPRNLLQGLTDANPQQLSNIEIVGAGSGLSWPKIDVDHYVPHLLEGIFGTRSWMSEHARRAGSVKTARKAASSRENGLKGGRPHKNRTAA